MSPLTYFDIHVAWTIPLLITLLIVVTLQKRKWTAREKIAPIANALMALFYTTPWDNYIVYAGVWTYPEDRVMAKIGYVPIEEYAFFILQSLISTIWVLLVYPNLRKATATKVGSLTSSTGKGHHRKLGTVLFAILSLAGGVWLFFDSTFYLGLLLAWLAPVCAIQWWLTGDLLMESGRKLSIAIFVPTLYLWIVDWYAINHGVWEISRKYTTGFQLFGLPLEEALFFLMTNIVLTLGVFLLVHPTAISRMDKILKKA